MSRLKATSTINKEKAALYGLWKEAPVGTARGWFVLGALWSFAWMSWGVSSSASRFAGEDWPCDDKRKRR